ncbi:hypothetical protein [Sphaerisporangium album]|uniref:hypothetical protein n=1 Tax=Sphaerisporangium album TaxID=509200 RepID=UPI0011C0728B|nr:hypothetical protein [Sphaerisporangium album]
MTAITRRAHRTVQVRPADLGQDYPAWRITQMTRSDGGDGGWWAFRHACLTTEERIMGLLPSIARRTLVDLVSEVAVQDDIAAALRHPKRVCAHA